MLGNNLYLSIFRFITKWGLGTPVGFGLRLTIVKPSVWFKVTSLLCFVFQVLASAAKPEEAYRGWFFAPQSHIDASQEHETLPPTRLYAFTRLPRTARKRSSSSSKATPRIPIPVQAPPCVLWGWIPALVPASRRHRLRICRRRQRRPGDRHVLLLLSP